jgi:hypothetical protein
MSTPAVEANTFSWITILISVISIAAGAISAFIAKAFRAGKKEASFEGQDSLFNNMLTNSIKDQVALKEELSRVCKNLVDINLRLTKIETIMSERDRFQRGSDKGYGAFRDMQERNDREPPDKWR